MISPAFQLHHALQRHLGWLLWLAVLLPVAQVATSWHALSHSQVQAAGAADDHAKHAPQLAHCDLCLAAAALDGGAIASAVHAPGTLPSRHELAVASALGVWKSPPPRAYRSRAPPPALL